MTSLENGSPSIAIVGIDLAMNVFFLHGVDQRGKAVFDKVSVVRGWLMEVVANLPPCLIRHPPLGEICPFFAVDRNRHRLGLTLARMSICASGLATQAPEPTEPNTSTVA
jgi:hypothetical protein